MTDGINLGLQPDTLRVILTTDADFLATIRLNVNWPAGTTLSIVFPNTTIPAWVATISTTDAVFSIANTVANAVPDGTAVKLTYLNGTTDQVWAIGTVVRRG